MAVYQLKLWILNLLNETMGRKNIEKQATNKCQ